MARKNSKKAEEKVHKVMHEFEEGKLKTSHGKMVNDHDQAVAIGLSEARQAGYKAPKKKDDD
jgi:hypothetical protein